MKTEEVAVDFTPDGIAALARIAAEVNRAVENIGRPAAPHGAGARLRGSELHRARPARRRVTVDADFVEKHLGELSRSADLSRYVL